MKFEIVGVQRKKGEYEGHAYDNHNLYVLSIDPNVTGKLAGSIKIKTPAFSAILQDNGISAADLLGKTVNISFDQYRNVESIEVLPQHAGK